MQSLIFRMNGCEGASPKNCPRYTYANPNIKAPYWSSGIFETIAVFAALVVPQLLTCRGQSKKFGHSPIALLWKMALFLPQTAKSVRRDGDTQYICGCAGEGDPLNVRFEPPAICANIF